MQSPLCHETIECKTVKSTYRRKGGQWFGWHTEFFRLRVLLLDEISGEKSLSAATDFDPNPITVILCVCWGHFAIIGVQKMELIS